VTDIYTYVGLLLGPANPVGRRRRRRRLAAPLGRGLANTELAAAATAHLRRRQTQANIVKALFRKPEVRYATA
jgi:hypothetical protein